MWKNITTKYFFTFNVKTYLLNRHRTNLGQNLFIIGPSIFPSWRVLRPSWTDRFQFFFAPLWAPLGPVRAWSRTPRRPPRRLLEASYTGKTHNSASYAVKTVKSITSKIVRFMLVKRTILKIHLPSFCILGPIFSTFSSFEHQYTSRSIQLHLGNAVCHMSDTLPNPFFSIMIGPKTNLKNLYPKKTAKKTSWKSSQGGLAMDRGEVHKTGIIRGSFFFFFLFFFFFFLV